MVFSRHMCPHLSSPVALICFYLCCGQRCLGDALMCAQVRLTELDLSDNAFGPDGVKGIERLLKSRSCHTLRQLKLNNCGMGVGGGKVKRPRTANSQQVRLQGPWEMTAADCIVQILAEALIECHRQATATGAALRLRVFVAGRNRLENEGASALAKAVQVRTSHPALFCMLCVCCLYW